MYTLNDADFVQVWEVLRKSRFQFIFRHGSLMWAMPTYVIYLLVSTLLQSDEPVTTQRIAVGLVISLLTGLVMGVWYYRANEARYRKLRPGK